ncbi:MAG: adenine phosphoribosyltransferase [Deltaproteobacteria bacterium]|nr:adenine phosphoribosyltransferase [Deltaproteobacteria bacterium]
MDTQQLAALIRNVPDFPKAGIQFKDISTLLKDGPAFHSVVEHLKERYADRGIEKVVGVEARGFIFGAALAYALGCGFVLVRKPGKLPAKTKSISYELEYGTDSLEIHEDALSARENVLLVDDLLATGGTIAAVANMVQHTGAVIAECAFVVELDFLNGRERLSGTESFQPDPFLD